MFEPLGLSGTREKRHQKNGVLVNGLAKTPHLYLLLWNEKQQ